MEAENVLGLIFDLTLEHHVERRFIDIAKEQVINYMRTQFFADDLFYLYHPDIIDVLTNIGEQVSAVSNYNTDGWKFDMEYALKQTLYVVGAEDIDSPKLICVISNRSRDPWLYKKMIKINKKDDFGCNILHIALGQIDEVEIEDPSFFSVKLEDPTDISEVIKETEYGRPDSLYGESESISIN